MRPLLPVLALLSFLVASTAVAAPKAPWRVREVRQLETVRHRIERPAGVTYDGLRDRLWVLDHAGASAIRFDGAGKPDAAATPVERLPAAHTVVDSDGRRLVAFDETRNEVVIVALGDDGLPRGEARRVRLPFVAPLRAAGIALGGNGDLFVLDRLSRRIFTYSEARWTGAVAGREGVEFAIGDVGPGELRGLAHDPSTRRFYTIVHPAARLVELDGGGAVTRVADLAGLGLVNPAGMTLAPSGDPADDPGVRSLYVADPEHAARGGAVVELRLAEAATTATATAAAPAGPSGTSGTATGVHVRTTRTWAFTPVSPDPTGIMYDAARNLLVITDSEVEETDFFEGINVFECALNGTVLRTGSTMGFSTEATGVARHPSTNRYFVTDDDERCVYLMNVGPDSLLGSADDTWSSFDTERFGCSDPEGVGYDPVTQTLFVAAGVGNKIYSLRAGEDTRFGTSDDVISSFDTEPLGVEDPEMIEFDPQRRSLFMVDDEYDIVEVGLDGALLNRIALGSIAIPGAGGITIGPHSSGSGQRSFYIVCRNGAFKNDGLLVEVTSDLLGTWDPVANGGSGGGSGGNSGGDDSTGTPPPPPPPPNGGAFPVLAGSDDVEQRSSSVTLTSSDLEMTVDGTAVQTVGIRFPHVTVTPGTSIGAAWIQFHADESHSARCSLQIQGHATDDAPTFTSSSQNVTSRPRTTASATWIPPAWSSGAAGAAQRSAPLTGIVQEIVNRPGWNSGNAIAFVITGTGTRTAVAFEGDANEAAMLHVKINEPPVADAGPDQTLELPAGAALSGTATDDGLPSPLQTRWSVVSGPGTVTFGDSAAFVTTAQFSAAGTYVLRLEVSDGGLTVDDDLEVVVEPANLPPLVNAGPDLSITMPEAATLEATASDPDTKPGTLTVSWSRVSGPGTVTFANASATTTTATFSAAGKYVLRITASDGALSASDDMRVVVEPPNEPPVVDAGPDQTITLPASAALAGAATDDGRIAPLTYTWTKRSGPGTVTFAQPESAATSASFSIAGVYVLRLTANDGGPAAYDEIQVTVDPEPVTGAGSWRIAASADDAEQGGSSGSVALTSGDLELVTDGTKVQTVGMRFRGVNIPRNATILNAWIQFTADAAHSGATSVTFHGQAADHAAAFTTTANGISSRARTQASVAWAPPSWTRGAASAAQKTPSLAAIVQEIVNRSGWQSGNALAFIVTGSGVRSAISYDGGATKAAVLHVELGGGSSAITNTAPVVDAGAGISVTLPSPASLDGTVSDDGKPNATPAVQWSKVSGPGTVTFASANAVDTQASFSTSGTYVLRLTANDGELSAADDVTVVVVAAPVTTTLELRVATAKDDAEEAGGSIDINGADLELVWDGANQQVGLRFQNLTIPRGATITNAWVQFTVDENQTGTASLSIRGQSADHPVEFSSGALISPRPRTTAAVSWSPAGWTEAVGTAGPAQRTPNLAPVIQEIVSRAGWASGNALVLIVTGTGHRTAAAWNKAPAQAPLLHVEYQ